MFENFDLAKECLARYDTDFETTDRMLRYFRISSNAVYPFRTVTGTRCVLRMAPRAEKTEDAVSSEIRLIEWLRGEGFPAMKPYPMRDGRLPATADVYGVVHYDFEADNVLFSPETGDFGVIDFDDAVRCWYALDVARALDSLGDVWDNLAPEEAADAFLAGYREERDFPEKEAETLPLMRRIVRLQEYGTILHVLAEPPEEMPDWMREIVGELRGRCREIEEEIA